VSAALRLAPCSSWLAVAFFLPAGGPVASVGFYLTHLRRSTRRRLLAYLRVAVRVAAVPLSTYTQISGWKDGPKEQALRHVARGR